MVVDEYVEELVLFFFDMMVLFFSGYEAIVSGCGSAGTS